MKKTLDAYEDIGRLFNIFIHHGRLVFIYSFSTADFASLYTFLDIPTSYENYQALLTKSMLRPWMELKILGEFS